ncbi:glycerophosphodiester phosphodiesterase [Gimesia aquarii]|nr:glycerophosphodiester phosphodiesterase family protein [Gimesia aquarii]
MISDSRFLTLLPGILLITLNPYFTEAEQPLIVAHRGLLQVAPENTLANFRACLELRLGFEFDVQRTKDGHLICIHDSTVDRTTNQTGKVSELTLAEVKQLDAGSWFDPRFAGEPVPTVEEVLQLVAAYRQHKILIAVDFKETDVEQDVVRMAERLNVLNRLLFIGRTIQEPKVRANIKVISNKAQTAAVANNASEFSSALAVPDADWIYVRYLPSKEEIERVHRANKRAFIAGATVSGKVPKNWQHASNVGIDAILTDYPLALRATLKQKKQVANSK